MRRILTPHRIFLILMTSQNPSVIYRLETEENLSAFVENPSPHFIYPQILRKGQPVCVVDDTEKLVAKGMS